MTVSLYIPACTPESFSDFHIKERIRAQIKGG